MDGEGNWTGADLNAGDIVRIKTNAEGKISGIVILWDMAEDVRADSNTTNYYTQITEGDAAGTYKGEVLYGGAVTAARNSDRVCFDAVDWSDSESIADQVYEWVNIAKADNVYTIQTIRYGNVSVESGGTFNYISAMFDNNGSHTFYYDGRDTEDAVNKENLPKYVDHVFVREYDGKIKDVVIVKPPKKVTVR